MPAYGLAEIAHLLQVENFENRALKAFRVDSRFVETGDIFFALPGEHADGHDFLVDVAARGAVAAVVKQDYVGPDYGLDLLRVPNVLEALQCLARIRLVKHRAKVVAITGSVGKTTTKDFLLTLLRQKYRVGASVGNQNSQIGLPLTLLNDISDDEDVIILEMGMTEPGNLEQLLTIAPADVALLTSVALVHAGSFENLEHIARTKAEIFTHPKTTLGILHRDIPNFDELSSFGRCSKLSFSTRYLESDYYLDEEKEHVVVCAKGQSHDLGILKVPGKHNRHNLLAAIAAARSLGVDWRDISEAIPHLQLPKRRLQSISKGDVLFVNDSYNACDVSVKAALDSLPAPLPGGRRIAVLGTMPGLGKFSDPCHRDVGVYALNCVDSLFCLGIECQPMVDIWTGHGRAAQLFLERHLLVQALQQFLQPRDVVLLKGANVKKMWEILDEIVLAR